MGPIYSNARSKPQTNHKLNMKRTSLIKTALLALALTAAVVLPRYAVAEDESEYSFVLHNTTKVKITGLMVSEDGEKWGKFDVGAGLNPG